MESFTKYSQIEAKCLACWEDAPLLEATRKQANAAHKSNNISRTDTHGRKGAPIYEEFECAHGGLPGGYQGKQTPNLGTL